MKNKGYFCPIANNNQLAGGAIGIDIVIVFDETIVIAEIISANKAVGINRAIAVNRANMANEADEASLVKVNESLANGGIAVAVKYSSKLLTLLPFSLTKYFEIFGLVFINQPAKMIVIEMGRSSLSKVVCGLEVGILSWSSLISIRECLEANCAPTEIKIDIILTTNWKEPSLKEVDLMKVSCPCANFWNTLHESFSSRTDTSIN